MARLTDAVTHILEPYLGLTVADTCVRATALSIGKTAETLEVDDLPALEASIRRLLRPVASLSTINAIVDSIKEEFR